MTGASTVVTGTSAVAEAYRSCELLTRARAANFYYGIRLLPSERRPAMCAVYAFARRVDDIGDGPLGREEKLARLDAQERALHALPADDGADPVLIALSDVRERFRFPASALVELIEGVRMDVDGAAYESFEELVPYCRRVAGAIGRVCLPIFGTRAHGLGDRERAESLADELGVAMQLTNILRDVREDAESGRVYLPREDLLRFGVIDGGLTSTAGGPARELAAIVRADDDEGRLAREQRERLAALMRFEAARARDWFARGIALTSLLDLRSAACVTAMAGIYRKLLARIESRPEQALRARLSLTPGEKAWVAARSVLGVGLGR